MKLLSALTLVLANLLSAIFLSNAVHAQEGELTRLFPKVAELSGSGGLCRLDVPAAVLNEAQPDFSDVRIVDADGLEVPFLIDQAQIRWPSDGPPPIASLVPTEITRQRSGLRSVEEVRVRLPDTPLPPGANWNIVVGSAAPSFVRQYMLMDGEGALLAEGSVFRLQSPLRARLDILLPNGQPGTEFRIRFVGEIGHFEPSFQIQATRMNRRGARLETPLVVADLDVESDSTSVELERPPGVVPSRLRFTTTSSFFARRVRVFDLREGRDPIEIGQGDIFRAQEAGAEYLEVPISRSSGDRLRVVIEDGDSPSLAGIHIVSLTLQPSLFYECGEGQMLYFGGGRAGQPRYDTQRFGGTMLGEAIARGEYTEASVGDARRNDVFDDGPALAYLMRAGRAVDRTLFRVSVPVFVQGAREGVSRVEPTVGLLARAAADLHDVRIVDTEGQQWPYVRAPSDVTVEVPLRVVQREVESSSVYALSSPEGSVELRRLFVTTTSEFVRRPFELRGIQSDESYVTLARGELNRGPDGPERMEIAMDHRGPMELVVEDGNDAPLELEVVGGVDAPVFYLIAPDGSYELLAGAEIEPPSYEVATALPLILATAVGRARVGETSDNPAFAPPPVPARFETEEIVVWAVLLFGVLILGFFTWRAAGESPEAGDDNKPGEDKPAATTEPNAPAPESSAAAAEEKPDDPTT